MDTQNEDPFKKEVEDLYTRIMQADTDDFFELATIAGIDLEDPDIKNYIEERFNEEDKTQLGLK